MSTLHICAKYGGCLDQFKLLVEASCDINYELGNGHGLTAMYDHGHGWTAMFSLRKYKRPGWEEHFEYLESKGGIVKPTNEITAVVSQIHLLDSGDNSQSVIDDKYEELADVLTVKRRQDRNPAKAI